MGRGVDILSPRRKMVGLSADLGTYRLNHALVAGLAARFLYP